MSSLIGMLPSVLMIVSPILITACGGMICERSGVVNIALEGLMGIGAFAAAAFHVLNEVALGGASVWIALLVGAFCGMLMSLIHAFASISLNADQTISGTGINLIVNGITIFMAQILFNADRTQPYQMGMKPIMSIGGIYPTAFIALAVVLIVWFVMYKLPFGLRLRACGEHPQAADSVGISVYKMRYAGVILSGILGGIGGFFYAVSVMDGNSNGHTGVAGFGFLALAVMIFGQWKPVSIFFAALFFAFLRTVAYSVPLIPFLAALGIDNAIYKMLPYVATMIILAFTSGKSRAPKAEGIPYDKGQR